MVTMVLLPENTKSRAKSAHKLVHVDNNQLLLTALEPYTTTALIELASRTEQAAGLPQRRKRQIWVAQPGDNKDASAHVVKPAGTCAMCIFGGITTWALLVCLLVITRRGSHYRDEEEVVNLRGSPCLPRGDRGMLESLSLDGAMTFTNTTSAALDFGRIRFSTPAAVVYPGSIRDVEATVRAVRSSGAGLTLAAKGRGHSVHGKAQVRPALLPPLNQYSSRLSSLPP